MKIHIVKKGESLYEIAKKYHVELDKLIAANPQIADPNVVDVGMKVKIPHDPKPVTPPTDYLYKHTVVQGDSLWKLGKAWGVPLADMVAANPQLKNPNVLMTGDIVYIPKLKPVTNSNPNMHPKADTSQIMPEAHLPMEAVPISEVPEAPVPTNVAPIMEHPEIPNVQHFPHIVANIQNIANLEFPHVTAPSPVVESVQHYETKEKYPSWEQPAQHPFQQFQMPAVEAMAPEKPAQYPFQQFQMPAVAMAPEKPAQYPFQQFQMPAEAMAPEQPIVHGKQKWEEPELPTMSAMPAMPSMPTMTQAAEMPYYGAHAAYPLYTPQPVLGGDCGCGGKMELPYSAQQPAFFPGMVHPNEPFLAMPQSIYPQPHMPIMPYAAEPAYPMFPMADISDYPVAPFYPGYDTMPFGMTMPWADQTDYGMHKSGGKEKSRGEQAAIAQATQSAEEKKPSKPKKRESSTRAAISRLIERNRRKARSSSRTQRAMPWLSR